MRALGLTAAAVAWSLLPAHVRGCDGEDADADATPAPASFNLELIARVGNDLTTGRASPKLES